MRRQRSSLAALPLPLLQRLAEGRPSSGGGPPGLAQRVSEELEDGASQRDAASGLAQPARSV